MRQLSLIAGIGSFILFWVPILAIPAGLTAVICGIVVIAKGRDHRKEGGGSDAAAIFGILFGSMGLFAASIIAIITAVVILAQNGIETLQESMPEVIEEDYTRM